MKHQTKYVTEEQPIDQILFEKYFANSSRQNDIYASPQYVNVFKYLKSIFRHKLSQDILYLKNLLTNLIIFGCVSP